ncbi:MAG: Na+/H+ antiporter NhaA [Coriobacteriia bacterium]|nr:Na+/H+ antiporter NhaA [Coriobacteriia bacterium]
MPTNLNSIIIPQLENRIERNQKVKSVITSSTVAAGIMVLAALVAVVIANTNAYFAIQEFLQSYIGIYVGDAQIGMSVEHFINDLLMAIFFLMVGIELKYEMTVGELTNPKAAMLPLLAAVGGVVVPALIYILFNVLGSGNLNGWAIPMATDIAFALGALSLLGNKVPKGVKVFFTTLAIADDIIAILVIAIFYGSNLQIMWLAAALLVTLMLAALNRGHIYRLWPYLSLGVVLWVFVYLSGIHATIAGVILAFTIPAKPMIMLSELPQFASEKLNEAKNSLDVEAHPLSQSEFSHMIREIESASHYAQPPLIRLEHYLLNFSNLVVLPIFAFFNAQVRLVGADMSMVLTSSVTLGVFFGLLLGKTLGIFSVSFALVKAKVARLPQNVNLSHIFGISILGGIGFTMSILIASLAFEDPQATLAAKTAILLATLIAAITGLIYMNIVTKKSTQEALPQTE